MRHLRHFCLTLALLALTGCATLQSVADWWHEQQSPPVVVPPDPDPTVPPANVPYVVRGGDSVCRDLTVPAWLEFMITNKQPGTPAREEVIAWSYSAGGDWGASNPKKGTFAATARDYNAEKAKLKTYGTDKFAGEPFMNMAWVPAESYTVRLAVNADEAVWSATNLSTGVVANATQAAKTPERVTLCYGDPRTRKAAIGTKITNVKYSEKGD